MTKNALRLHFGLRSRAPRQARVTKRRSPTTSRHDASPSHPNPSLQEQGLLRRYYQEFVRDHERDPTGYRTLMRLVGSPDPDAFQEQWERYVLGLRFP